MTETQINLLIKFAQHDKHDLNLHDLLDLMADYGKQLVECDRCSVFIHDVKAKELYTTVAQDSKPIRIQEDCGVAGYTLQEKEVQIVVDAYNDFRFSSSVDEETGYTTRNILAVPLANKHQTVFGVFQALNKKDGLFTALDAQALQLLSACTLNNLNEAFKEHF